MPWQYVLADAAVSGTLACRTGYTLAKSLVERRDESGVAWFLIDDLSRMSRNTIESLRLGELADETGVRVIGASDGFDSANPQSSLLLPVLGSMNEAFITQLRSKVKRGMDDAFRRGDNIQPPGVGYRLVEVKDASGNLVITHKRHDRETCRDRSRSRGMDRAGSRDDCPRGEEPDRAGPAFQRAEGRGRADVVGQHESASCIPASGSSDARCFARPSRRRTGTTGKKSAT